MIKILLFAGLREESGKSELEIESDNLSISGSTDRSIIEAMIVGVCHG